jgi:hypothetical protein
MCVDLGDALRRCKESRKPANEVTAYLARELSNSPKHADDPGFIILESHKGKDRGKMVCRQSAHDPFCNRPDRDLREGRGPWRKPRGVAMHLTNDDDRERLRHKSGWYAGYTERAEDALRFLSLTGDEFEIVRHASWGDSPEEIVRMSRFNAEYVNGVIAGLPQRLRAHEEETERIARIRRADSRS